MIWRPVAGGLQWLARGCTINSVSVRAMLEERHKLAGPGRLGQQGGSVEFRWVLFAGIAAENDKWLAQRPKLASDQFRCLFAEIDIKERHVTPNCAQKSKRGVNRYCRADDIEARLGQLGGDVERKERVVFHYKHACFHGKPVEPLLDAPSEWCSSILAAGQISCHDKPVGGRES